VGSKTAPHRLARGRPSKPVARLAMSGWPRRRRPRIGFVLQKWSLSRCCRRAGFISFNCAHCSAAGYVHDHGCAAPDNGLLSLVARERAKYFRQRWRDARLLLSLSAKPARRSASASAQPPCSSRRTGATLLIDTGGGRPPSLRGAAVPPWSRPNPAHGHARHLPPAALSYRHRHLSRSGPMRPQEGTYLAHR
jgi:hypothetical protein